MPDGELISVTISDGIKKFSELGRHDNSNQDKSKYKKVCIGDIAYNSMRMWQGASGYSPFEGIVSPAYTVLKPNVNINSKCVSYLFKRQDMIHVFQLNSQGITSDNWNLKFPALSQIAVSLPGDIKEQSRIATYFSNIDTLITLHQRKLEKLKIIKKSMLEKCFPKKGEKVPKIRFSGFTDDWKQRKLGDVANSFEYGLNVAAKAYDGINKYIRITDIDDVSRKFLFNNLTSPNVNISEAINYQLKKGDILFARTGASVGKTYLYSEKDGMVFYAGFLIRAKISSSYDSNFIFQNTLTENYRRYIQITSQRSGQPGVNAQEYGEYKLMIPRLLEQKKIGNYFKYLDTLITLHQRKLNILKSVPKFLLGIVWEQRKLGDIVTRVIRKNENLESKLPLTISAQFGLIAQDEFFDKRIASKNISHYYLIRKGEFAYNKSTSMDAPWGAIKRLEHYDNGVLSTLYIMFRILDENKVNSDYIVSYYVTNLWHKGVREVAAEGARNHGLLNIAPVDFFETTLTIPSNENEQKNIGEYFRRLDRLITLHQRQQNLWKFVRKGVKLWIILTKNQILKRP